MRSSEAVVAGYREGPIPVSLVVVLGALSGFGPLSIDMYLPGLPDLQRQFHASPSVAQLTLTACLVGLAGAQLVIGPSSDRIGRRRPLLIGIACYSAASIACALAPWLWLFIVLRLVQGAAGAAGIVLARAIVRDLRSGTRAARLFAMLMIVNGFFPALAPVFGAQLLRVGDWRLVFVVLALLGGLLFVSALVLVPEIHPADLRRRGGLDEAMSSYRRLFADRRFVAYALATGFVTGAMFAYISGSPFVLEDIFGVSPQGFSGVFAMNAAGIVAASQLGARLVERLGPRTLLRAGIAMSLGGGAGLVVSIFGHLGLAGVLPSLFFVVAAVGLVSPNATALAMADYPDIAGSASGVVGVLQFLIGALLAPVVGAFGTRTAAPMALVIAALALAAAVIPGGLLMSAGPAPSPGGARPRVAGTK